MTAMVALIPMAAQGSGSAYLDGAHDPQLIAGQPMGFSISKAVLTENIRHLKAARCSHLPGGLRNLLGCSIEGTDDLGQVQPTDMQIDGGRGGGSVAQKAFGHDGGSFPLQSGGWRSYALMYGRWLVL